MDAPQVLLKKKRAEILQHYRHPWVFSKGLSAKPTYPAGTIVRVCSDKGHVLGHAFYHPRNPISLRMIRFDDGVVDEAYWRARIRDALGLRRTVLPRDCRSFRLIHGENDGFPGLTVDVYDDVLCMQITTSGFEAIKDRLAVWLAELTGARAVFERSEGHARKQEGLAPATGFLTGNAAFPMEIEENGLFFEVDPAADQKTGFYLDQRAQRVWVQRHSRGLHVLDLCCYSGGFTIAALSGGASEVLSVDVSVKALEGLARNLSRNGLAEKKQTSRKADIFELLKQLPEGKPWDLVIMDPPSLAKSVRAEPNARKAYRGLNRQVCKWVAPGGRLLTFSCTGVLNSSTFRQSVFLGLRDSQREGLVLEEFGAGPDHPVSLRFPEGTYLKGLALYLP